MAWHSWFQLIPVIPALAVGIFQPFPSALKAGTLWGHSRLRRVTPSSMGSFPALWGHSQFRGVNPSSMGSFFLPCSIPSLQLCSFIPCPFPLFLFPNPTFRCPSHGFEGCREINELFLPHPLFSCSNYPVLLLLPLLWAVPGYSLILCWPQEHPLSF